jgi:hypothetical protein
MNKFKLILALIVLVILMNACQNNSTPKKEISTQNLFDSLSFSYEDEKKDSSSYFKMNYVLLNCTGFDKAINDSINTDLRSFIFEVEPSLTKTLKQLLDESKTNLVNEYHTQLKDFPENYNGYDHDIDQNLIFKNNQFISLEVVRYSFAAGAHGMGWTDYLHHDLKTGKRLYLNDFIQSKNKLIEIAEIEFRKQMGLKKTDNLEENGFWFTNNKFHINENFCFKNDSLEFLYNQYEIAPFSMGPIGLKVSLNQIKSDIKIEMFKE